MPLTCFLIFVLRRLLTAAMVRRCAPKLLPALAAACFSTAQAQPSTGHIAACGLEFDLPAGHKITRPSRMADAQGGASCSFDIVRAKPEPPQRGDCKDKADGGQPPYNVCDWVIGTGPASPSVQVVRAPPGGSPLLSAFVRDDDGRWGVVNAQAGIQPAQAIDFFGKSAWKGETIMRMYWYRQRVKNYNGIYAGSGGSDVTLV